MKNAPNPILRHIVELDERLFFIKF